MNLDILYSKLLIKTDAKLALVVLLSALHGMLSGNLRRLSRQEDSRVLAGLRYIPMAILLVVFLIVVLVLIKPF